MARLPRYVIPGQPQHIIQRGNNREAIFGADADYRFFRGALVEAATRQGLAIHDDGLTPHPEYLKLGRNPPERERAYRQLFQTDIALADLADIRDCSRKGWALGSERFKEHIEALAKRRATSKGLGRPSKEKNVSDPIVPYTHRPDREKQGTSAVYPFAVTTASSPYGA